MNSRVKIILSCIIILGVVLGYLFNMPKYKPGDKVDEFNGVSVFYNGKMGHVEGRNVVDGYNIGLKWQCVEFVKRYYYEYYNHKMPDSYGHAKDFFKPSLKDGALNKQRDLLQFTNPSMSKPQIGDLIIFSGSLTNAYGHVAIVSSVNEEEIEIIQQNKMPARQAYSWSQTDGKYSIHESRILGWLRKP